MYRFGSDYNITVHSRLYVQPSELSDDEINAQVFVFFIAGFETTASLLRFASYCLALNPEIDEKLFEEIEKKIGDVRFFLHFLHFSDIGKPLFLFYLSFWYRMDKQR